MKKSLNAWTVEERLSFEEMFAAVSRAGFAGIELNVDAPGKPHALSMETTEADYARIRALTEKYSLPVISISTSLSDGMSGIPARSGEYRALLLKQIEAARALGAKGILTAPGGMGDGITLKAARENTIAFFKEMRAEIESLGIFVGLENVWNGFFLSPFDMHTLLCEIGSPMIGAYLDTGNMIAFSTSEYWPEVLAGQIGFVHVKDYRRNGGLNSGGTWQDLTNGSADWTKIIPALRAAGFDGYLTAEVFKADGDMSYEDYYAKVSRELDVLLGY